MSSQYIQNKQSVIDHLSIVRAAAQLLIAEIEAQQITTNREAEEKFDAIINHAHGAKRAANQ